MTVKLTADCHGLDNPRQEESLAYSANPNHVSSTVICMSITSVVTAVGVLLILS